MMRACKGRFFLRQTTTTVILGVLTLGVHVCRSQTQNSTEILQELATQLRGDLERGAISKANLHAMEIHLALHGVLKKETADRILLESQREDVETVDPSLTNSVIPTVDKLSGALADSDSASINTYSQQIVDQIRASYRDYLRRELAHPPSSLSDFVAYLAKTKQLAQSLRANNIAKAVALSVELQSITDALHPELHGLDGTYAKNVYNINDALGRAAYLQGDYQHAGEYLLKAANTAGNAELDSFGPNLWLANELLNRGYKDIVVSFFESCKKFWETPKLDQWISSIQNGVPVQLSPNSAVTWN